MSVLTTILLLLALLLFAFIYIVLNVGLAQLLIKKGRQISQSLITSLERFWWKNFQALSTTRIWAIVLLNVGGIATVFHLQSQPLSPLVLATALLGYVFYISIVTLLLLVKLPFFVKLWQEPAVKVCILTLPILSGFFVKGYAGLWIGEVLGVNATNTGYTLLAATAFLLCGLYTIPLAIAMFLFESLLILSPIAGDSRGSRAKKVGTYLLLVSGFCVTYIGIQISPQFSLSKLGNPLLAATAFELDASPATHCELTKEQRALTQSDAPIVKALHLSTSQERAVLLQRSPSLFLPIVWHDFVKEPPGTRRVDTIAVTGCYLYPPTTAKQ